MRRRRDSRGRGKSMSKPVQVESVYVVLETAKRQLQAPIAEAAHRTHVALQALNDGEVETAKTLLAEADEILKGLRG